VKTPRDRKGSFRPKLVAKRQTRLAGLDERILSFYIGGMSVRDIARTCPIPTAGRSAATQSAG
jgi:putative transposase